MRQNVTPIDAPSRDERILSLRQTALLWPGSPIPLSVVTLPKHEVGADDESFTTLISRMLGTRKPIITFENWHQTSSVLFNYFVDQDLKILASAKDMIVNDLEKGENMNKFEFSYQSMVSMISTHQFNHHNFFTTLLHHAVRYRAHSFEDLNNWIDVAPIVLGKKPAWAYEAVDSFLIYDISYGLSPQSSATTLSSILTDARVCTSATRGSGNENIRPYCARRLSRRS